MSAYQNLLSVLIEALGWETTLFMAVIGATITTGISLWLLIVLATKQHQARLRLADTRRRVTYTWRRDRAR